MEPIHTVTSDNGKYRAVVIYDDVPDFPETDCMPPLLRVNSRTAERVGHAGMTAENAASAFMCYYGTHKGVEVFERYARIFLSAQHVETYNIGLCNEYGYIAYDTPEWRKYAGLETVPADSRYLAEVKAYCTGETYAVELQRRVTWTADVEGLAPMVTWETLESVYGYYGMDAALEALQEFDVNSQEEA